MKQAPLFLILAAVLAAILLGVAGLAVRGWFHETVRSAEALLSGGGR